MRLGRRRWLLEAATTGPQQRIGLRQRLSRGCGSSGRAIPVRRVHRVSEDAETRRARPTPSDPPNAIDRKKALSDSNKSAAGGKDSDGAVDRRLDGASQASIEKHLRVMFEEVASEPVPDRFLTLLNQLERDESRDARQSFEDTHQPFDDANGMPGPARRSPSMPLSGSDGSE